MILLSTAYFPPISWMSLLYQHQEIVIDLNETYPKQTFRNRCQIATTNGLMDLSVPIKKPNGNQTKTKETQIDYQQNWPLLHWKSIKTAYQSSPFFLYYQDEVEALFHKKHETLFELNEQIIQEISSLIGFSAKINYSAEFIHLDTLKDDYRFSIHPKKNNPFIMESYHQVFEEKFGYLENLSILDLLFNEGPESIYILEKTVSSSFL